MRISLLALTFTVAVVLGSLAMADDGDAAAATADGAMFKALPADTPAENGQVPWLRSWDAAVKESESTGKPLFVQFQELPG